jgi:signal transduction histidine kinase
MLLGLGGTVRYSSPGAKFFFAFSTYLFITAWLYTTLQHLNSPRLLSIVTWFSGISLAFVIALFSPMFLSLSLLCIVSTVLHGISLENIHRNEIFIGSVITLTSVAGVVALTEWSYFNGYIFDFQLFDAAGRDLERLLNAVGAYQLAARANMIVESAFRIPLLIGFSINILQMLWRFYIRIESNITRMQRTNADLTTAQQDLQQRLYERTQLLEVSRSVSSTQDFSSLLSNTLIQLKTVVDYGRATVLLVRDDQLEGISSAGHLPNLSTKCLTSVVLSKANLTSLSDLRDVVLLETDHSVPETDLSCGIDGSNLIVPLVVRGRLIGLLTIRHDRENFYDRHDADLCMAFANQVAGIIDSAQLQQAATDALINAERSRLARELHDSVSQSLFGIVLGTRKLVLELCRYRV